jgi:hypothetical protein
MSLVVFGLKVKAAVYSPVSPRTGWITLDSTIVRGDGPSQSDLRSPIRTAKARTARTRRRRSFLPDLLGCGGAGVRGCSCLQILQDTVFQQRCGCPEQRRWGLYFASNIWRAVGGAGEPRGHVLRNPPWGPLPAGRLLRRMRHASPAPHPPQPPARPSSPSRGRLSPFRGTLTPSFVSLSRTRVAVPSHFALVPRASRA